MHAIFNRSATQNTWTISAGTLRSFAEYFGPRTEQLDIFSENGRTTFTSYTEKIMNGKGLHNLPPFPILGSSYSQMCLNSHSRLLLQ